MRYLLFFLLLTAFCYAEKLPVDISFYVVDLKYNSEQGVKICEVQSVFASSLKGHKAVYGHGCLSSLFGSILQSYEIPVWFGSRVPITKKFNKVKSLKALTHNPLFKERVKKRVENSHSIADFQGIVCMNLTIDEYSDFHKKFPAMMVLNAAGIPYKKNKQSMNALFKGKEELVDLRPKSNVYKREYSSQLVDKILKEIPGEYLVIKPPAAVCGRGIIIFSRNELKQMVKYISNPKSIPKHCKNASLCTWKDLLAKEFIVEQFIPSDPVEFNGKLYDATMRALCLLIYDHQKTYVEFFGGYWKLPYKPLDDNGSFAQKHKSRSFGDDYFLPVDEEVLEKVEEQLKAGLPYLHLNMLEVKNESGFS